MTAAVKTDTSPCGPRSQVDIGTRLRCYSPPFERRPTMRCASPPRRALTVALSLTLGCVALSGATAQQENVHRLARRIVTTSVGIKPGEVVVITGGKHTVPLMEALAIEAQKAGGMVTIFLSSDSVVRSLNVDVPEQFLSQEPRFFAEWLKQVDVFITLPSASNIKALDAGVPATRLGKLNQAGQFLTPLLDDMKFREVDITYPTRERGASWGIEGQTYVTMMWNAIGADYQRIAQQGDALRDMLQGAKSVHVTSERHRRDVRGGRPPGLRGRGRHHRGEGQGQEVPRSRRGAARRNRVHGAARNVRERSRGRPAGAVQVPDHDRRQLRVQRRQAGESEGDQGPELPE